jgi:fatty acid/phospholipid biosynthesis enzyme
MAKPEARITLAVDVMGGDKGPSEVLSGIIKSSSFVPRDLKFLLFGPEQEIFGLLSENSEWQKSITKFVILLRLWQWMKNLLRELKTKKSHPWL